MRQPSTFENVQVRPPLFVGAAAPALLDVDQLTRTFGERVALDRVSFRVAPGEVFGLLGPNGAGKSTIFQILAGLLLPHSGNVSFWGRPLAVEDPVFRARTGVVFQKGSLDDLLTARENLLLGARLYAMDFTDARERCETLLELIELRDRGDERVAGWSGGMRRRLEIARALIHRPSLLLLDEPTQGIDEASFRRIWAHLRSLRESEQLTLILTTHRPEEAEQCDRLALLDAGRLVTCETPAALAAKVGGDVVTIEADQPEEVASLLAASFGITAQLVDGRIQIERPDGHALIPRLVEAFPRGRLHSISLRKPTLADVFLKLTGRALGADRPTERAPAKRRR